MGAHQLPHIASPILYELPHIPPQNHIPTYPNPYGRRVARSVANNTHSHRQCVVLSRCRIGRESRFNATARQRHTTQSQRDSATLPSPARQRHTSLPACHSTALCHSYSCRLDSGAKHPFPMRQRDSATLPFPARQRHTSLLRGSPKSTARQRHSATAPHTAPVGVPKPRGVPQPGGYPREM